MKLFVYILALMPSLLIATNVYVTSGDDVISVFNADSNTFIEQFTPSLGERTAINLQGIAISPDQTTAYVVDQGELLEGNSGVWILNTGNNSATAFIPLEEGRLPAQIGILPDGSKIYIADKETEVVFVVRLADNAVSTIADGAGKPSGIAFNPNGSQVYVSDVASGATAIYVYNTSDDTLATTITGVRANFIAVNSQGIGYEPGSEGDSTQISTFDTADNSNTGLIGTAGELLNGVAFTNGGEIAYVASNTDSTLQVITNGVNTSTISLTDQPWQVVINPINNSQIYCTANPNSTVMVISNGAQISAPAFDENLTSAVFLAYIVSYPPRSLTGQQIYNRFVLQTDIVNRLTWRRSVASDVVGYSIFRNGQWIAYVTTLGYDDHNRPPSGRDFYEVRAITASGNQSTPASIYIP